MKVFIISTLFLFSVVCKSQTVGDILAQSDSLCAGGKYVQAIDLIVNYQLQHAPNDSLYYYLGMIKTDYLLQHVKALDDFKKALAINPQSAYGYFGLGKAYLELNQLNDAELNFAKAANLAPNMFEAAFNLAYTYYLQAWDKEKYFKQAIPQFTQAIALDSSYLESYYLRGVCYYQVKKYQEAMTDFDQYEYSTAPELIDTVFYYFRGFDYYFLENYEMAAESFKNYSRLDSLNSDALYFRGICNLKLSESDEAMHDFEQYLSFNPGTDEVYMYLAQLYENNENSDKAYLYYLKADSTGNKEAKKALAKNFPDRTQDVNLTIPSVHFTLQKNWAVEEIQCPSEISHYNGALMHNPDYSIYFAVLKNDSIAINQSAVCDVWWHYFKSDGVEDRFSTANKKWIRIISDDIWQKNDFERFPVKVWKLVPVNNDEKMVVYIWAKPNDLKDYSFYIDEFIESLK